ncbi:MAG: hypothetical protein HY913_15995 [Desulfomonile tiedjei]|nr:hypothetical protein [Desulfomonile tiedjei]
MVTPADAKELLASLIRRGETLDSHDMTVLYGWIYSSYIALEPFPWEHRKFCERCLDSFDPPGKRFASGLLVLREALEKSDKALTIREAKLSDDYKKLLRRVLEWTKQGEEPDKSL